MTVVAFTHLHRRALFVLLGLLMAAGGYALWTSARSIYPAVAFPRIMVIAERGEAPVRGMLVAVTRPVEQAVAAVPDLLRVRSKTVRGASELALDFRPSADMLQALSMVRARTAAAGLPAEVTLRIEQQTPAVFPVLSFNVIPGPVAAPDPVARARLAEWCQLDLQPRLARLPDAFFVTVQSGDHREYVFEADPVLLAQAGVGILEVRDAIRAANTTGAVGRSSGEGLQYQLLVDGLLTDPAQVPELAVPRESAPPVRLADLGRLVETTAERTMVVTGGGKDGVVMSVFLRDGGKVTDLSADVDRVLDDVRARVPGGGAIVPVYDQAQLVDDSIAGVRDAIALGAVLAVVVMSLFLGNWRLTVVAGLAIPASVVLTFAIFPLLGESLNIMSLGGLAVAIGLIIDDAIVVVESVARKLVVESTGGAPIALFAAVARGTREVVGAVMGSSLTTVVVFAPLVLLEGVVGQFFRSLALALGASILASMAVSLVFTPLLLLLPGLAPELGVRPRRWMAWIEQAYAALVVRVLRQPLVVASVLLAVMLAGFATLSGIGTGFLPEMDEGGFVLDYFLPVGTSLEETDRACRRIEAVLAGTPEVTSFSRRTGAELGFFATEQFTGDFLVGLAPRERRARSVFEVIDSLRDRLARETPQAEVEFIQVMQDTINDLAGNPAAIEIRFFGSEYPPLQRAADAAGKAIGKIPGIVDVKSHVSFGSPELTWRPDPLAAARAGLSTESIAGETAALLLGEVATRIQEGDRFVDLRVRAPLAWRSGNATEDSGPPLFLHVGGPTPAAGAGLVPLGSVAGFRRSLAENELERENQVPMVRVEAGVSGRDLGSAAAAIRSAVGRLPLDPGVRVEYGGQVESQERAFQNLVVVFALGAGLVFLLLVAQFRSLRLPLVMFLALPFGALGGLHALKLVHVPLNLSSGMGLIMLVGLAVKNGIIMIEYAQTLCQGGRAPRDAMVEAARVRLRPILMTTLSAIAGLLPLAAGLGAGSEFQRPLAITVIGGLAASTMATLVVVPLGCITMAKSRLLPEPVHAG